MARYVPHFSTLRTFVWSAALAAFVCATPATFAQHGGGGGGHFGGGGHGSSPHVSSPGSGAHLSAPGVSGAHTAAPPRIVYIPPSIRVAGAPAAGIGTRNFVALPRVQMLPPLAGPRPVLGDRLIPPPSSPAGTGPHMTIGFPPDAGRDFVSGQALSFSGEGHEIHQNTSPSDVRVAPADRDRIHIHPGPPARIFPGRPGFPVGRPFWGNPFFGGPFFGLRLGWEFNGWGPACGSYWSWGFGCNTLGLYDYGLGYGGGGYYGDYNYGEENLEAQPDGEAQSQAESQANEPYIYEYPPAAVTGGGERRLVELYLKNGSVYQVTDYWLVNDELHFTTLDASGQAQTENVAAFSELDLQKTVDVNSARGFRFVLRNEPVQEYLEQQQESGPAAPAVPPQPPTPREAPVPQNPQ
jgi:hypothetical protein